MMFDASDPRSKLSSSKGGGRFVTDVVPAQYCPFRADAPTESSADTCTWHARGQNFVVAYSEVQPGARFVRDGDDQPDEHILMLPDAAGAIVELAGERHELPGRTLAILPPGRSTTTATGTGRVIRFFTPLAADVEALCANRDAYAEPQPNNAPFEPWPDPVGGFKLRTYPLDGPMGGIGFARIYRSTNLMVMDCEPRTGARDWSKSTAHQHEDFEQGCLILAGEYSYHLRYPWVPDMAKWIEDTHERVQATTVVVIPPAVLHTNGPEAAGTNHVVDVYSPPRSDFAEQPGWCVNEEDYPLPPHLQPARS